MNILISTLFNTNQHKLAYLIKSVIISVIPATFIAYLVYQVNPIVNESINKLPLLSAITQLAFIAPVIETFFMWPIIAVTSRLTKDKLMLTAAISACLWAIIHALFNLNWGLTILWPFFIFSLTFCVWRRKSLFWAIVMAASVHALQNLLAVLYLNFA